MKVIVCLLLAIHVAIASDLCMKSYEDLNIPDYLGLWYNNARVKNRPEDANSKCLYFDSQLEGEKFVFKRYEVDSTTNKEIERTGYAEVDLKSGKTIMNYDDSDQGPVAVSLLCLNPEFEISYFGDLADQQIYIYTKQMHLSDELYHKIEEALKGLNIDASKLLPVQVNCPKCNCEGHDHSHDGQLHGYHGHDHSHHNHHNHHHH